MKGQGGGKEIPTKKLLLPQLEKNPEIQPENVILRRL